MALTEKQIASLTVFNIKRLNQNSEMKAKTINHLLKQYGVDVVVNSGELAEFYTIVVPQLQKDCERAYFLKCQQGVIDSNYTPLRLSKTEFKKVDHPVVGRWYHLTWAFKGAKFQLKEVNCDKGIVWTGRTKNKMLTINIADLRHFA